MATPSAPALTDLVKALSPSQIKAAMRICFATRRAPLLHGDPGIGKSDSVIQLSDELFAEVYGYRVAADGTLLGPVGPKSYKKMLPVPHGFMRPWLMDFRAAQFDNVDIHGLPYLKNGKAAFALPELLPTDVRGGIFFLDELNRGSELVLNALLSLILTGKVGDYTMPSTWLCVGAVNDRDAGVRKLSSALNARFTHLEAAANLEDVIAFGNSRDWHPAVLAFLRFSPQLLHEYRPQDKVSPNPRAWHFVSDFCKQDMPEAVLLSLLSGTVGPGAAITFMGFLKLYKGLPAIEDIFADPATARLVDTPQTMYAVAAALVRRTCANTFAAAAKYMERLPAEFMVMFMHDLTRRLPELRSTATFTRWGLANASVTF